MKIFYTGLLSLAFVLVFFSAEAKVSTTKCSTIQDGNIVDSAGMPISVGYDKWGYNYQAHMFNGLLDNYSRGTVVAETGDSLMMKWNDAWLSNKDCDGDKKLDRANGASSYIGSGAWLTNHMKGNYTVPNLSGISVINFELNSVNYPNDVILEVSNGSVTGVIGWPSGASPYAVNGIVSGTISGDTISLTIDYNDREYTRYMTGIISDNGSIIGTWSDYGTADSGSWTANTSSTLACTYSDFVKIIAAPNDADLVDGYWELNNEVIGPDIWGEFAIIQEVTEDSCGKMNLVDIKSSIRSGLGNW